MLVTVTEVTAQAMELPTGAETAAQAANAEAEIAAVLRQVEDLNADGEPGAAQEELSKAIDRFGERGDLLVRLAEIYVDDDQLEAAMNAYRRAVTTDPADPAIAAKYCKFLHALGLQRQAMALIASLPPDVANHPKVRGQLGSIYHAAGWRALAVDAYGHTDRLESSAGHTDKLESSARRDRLLCWWASGGPIPVLRRWACAFDHRSQRNWHRNARALPILDDLGQAEGFNHVLIVGEVDGYLQTWARLWTPVEVAEDLVQHWVYRYLVSLTAAWVIVFVALDLTSPRKGAASAAIAASISVAIAAPLRKPLREFAEAAHSAVSWLIRSVLSGTALVAGGIALITAVSAPPAWAGVVGLALITAVGIAALDAVCWYAPALIGVFRYNALARSRPRAAILDHLIDLIFYIDRPDSRNDLASRNSWMWLLEDAAKRLERDLAKAFPCRDPQTTEWVRERTAGAAAALRSMKRHIAVPAPGSWNRLAAGLRQDAASLVSGNLRLMRWTQPPSAQAKRKSLLRKVLTITQRVLVAAIPVVVVFALHTMLGLSGSNLVLARGVAIFWAVFYIVISIDPELVSKVQQARDVFTEIKSIGGPKA
jgi:Tfp pilus assembly protein PilF